MELHLSLVNLCSLRPWMDFGCVCPFKKLVSVYIIKVLILQASAPLPQNLEVMYLRRNIKFNIKQLLMASPSPGLTLGILRPKDKMAPPASHIGKSKKQAVDKYFSRGDETEFDHCP